MNALSQNLRFSVRTLRKTPVFTAVAILSLALGIGANTAIFTLMDQVILRLLPVKDPQNLVLLNGPGPDQARVSNSNAFSYPMYVDFRDKNTVFSGIMARFGAAASITYKGSTERAQCELVSGNYFEVLGVRPHIGRTLTPDDDRTPGAHPLVVLSFPYWQRKFGADPGILNAKVNVNGHPMTVIGVAPPGFTGTEIGEPVDFFTPIVMKAQITPTWDELYDRRSKWLNAFGRLKEGVSPESAQAAMQVLYRQILEMEVEQISTPSKTFRGRFLAKKIELLPAQTGRSQLRRDFKAPLFVLMGMVGFVLLIACANVANLLMARAAARQKDIAIRLALGASRGTIVRQLLCDSMVLALAGGAFGLLVAVWTGDVLLGFLPLEGGRQAFSTAPDSRVLLFNFAVALLAGLIFGLFPALQLARHTVASTLKTEAGNVSSNASQVRLRKALVVAQIALSLLLLFGATLFARSLYNLRSLNPGFLASNVMTFTLDPSLNGYSKERTLALYENLQQRLGRIPGVRSVSNAEVALMSGDRSMATVHIEGYQARDGEDMNPDVNAVGPAFFATLGIPVIAGRDFTERDEAKAPKVAIVNETFAKRYFGTENPLGRRIGFGRSREFNLEIVGVVKDGKRVLREESPRWVYVPFPQITAPSQATFYVRTSLAPLELAQSLRREIRSADANLPVFNLKSLEQQVDESLFTDRVIAALSAFFGLLATALAAVGLYGVMAYTVTRRTKEIGIRVALGAERANVVWLILKEVAILSGVGIGIGVPAAIALSRLVRSQLYGLDPHDPLALLLAVGTLVTVAFLAGYLPAMRATRIDPLIALRYE